MACISMFGSKDGDKDDDYYVDGVTEEEINVDDEFKSAEEYVAEYDE